MARYLRIRSIVKTERTDTHERIKAICGLMPDGSHWTLTREDAVSQVENRTRSEEHTSELQSQSNLVCRLLLEKKKNTTSMMTRISPVIFIRLLHSPLPLYF